MIAFRSHDSMLQWRRERWQYACSILLVLPCLQHSVRREQYHFLSYNLQRNTWIVYSLWVPHFSKNNIVVSYFVAFHAAQKPWNGLIICLQAPKSFDPCHGSLSQALEMIAGNPRIRPISNSLDHTLCLVLKWDRYQWKKSLHSNISSRRDQGCSHSRSSDLPPSWKIWNTNMATQISREICDVMWKRSIRAPNSTEYFA